MYASFFVILGWHKCPLQCWKHCRVVSIKAGFHTCVSSMHNCTRCLSMYGLHCSQAILAFAIKTCALATKSHMLNFCEACAAICCDLWKPITQDTEYFSFFRKKEISLKQKKYNGDFRKVVISNSTPGALRDLHTSNYKGPRNNPDNDCLWKPAKRNNVRTSKQLRFFVTTEIFNGNQDLGKGVIWLDALPGSTNKFYWIRIHDLWVTSPVL